MNNLTILTSGSTGDQKIVNVSKFKLINSATNLNNYLRLTDQDILLDYFPTWTIAHWVFVAELQSVSRADVLSINFVPRTFWDVISEHKPTFIPIAVRTLRTLMKLEKFKTIDLSETQWLTGSAPVEQNDIDALLERGAKSVWNVYGSTENPPPVFAVKNSTTFDLSQPCPNNECSFVDGELLVSGIPTGDVFSKDGTFSHRKSEEKNSTWKSV